MLRALMKKKELDKANSDLNALREAATELEKRYADIEKMIEEAETEEEETLEDPNQTGEDNPDEDPER